MKSCNIESQFNESIMEIDIESALKNESII